ncbi:MAG: hypothetical protein JXB50_02295 [Spirochaetes bacterium]|nr:hypothetical protein [Spirochaetota bacterium]
MNNQFLRKYGIETVVNFSMFQIDGVDFKSDAVYSSGDVKIMKDESNEANTSNGFVDEGQGYSLILTASEMQAKRIVLYFVDQTSPKAWLDFSIIIETYGNVNAMHPNFPVDVESVKGNAVTNINDFKADVSNLDVAVSTRSSHSTSDIMASVIETGFDFKTCIQVLVAIMAGKTNGGGTGIYNFRNLLDTLNRVQITVDENKNRITVIITKDT